MKNILLAILCLFTLILHANSKINIVKDGKSNAVIVTADNPTKVADYAAKQLAYFIEKSSGAKLPIIKESENNAKENIIYVGNTKATRENSLTQDKFPNESFIIKVIDKNLYLVGGENNQEIFYFYKPKENHKQTYKKAWSNGIVRDTRRGTIYAVNDFVDRILGVKYLWPGELGIYAPKLENIVIDDDLEIKGKPYFKSRRYRSAEITLPYFRNYLSKVRNLDKLTYSRAGLTNYVKDLQKFLVYYQDGDSEELPALAPHIEKWWKTYGKEHPNWFAQRDDGSREPAPGTYKGQNRLCVSDESLHKHIVENEWDGGDWIGLGEADTRGFCRCEKCMAWDGVQPDNFNGYSTTNRYVRYAQAVHKLAVKKNPNVKISILIYMDYFMPPTINEDLSWLYAKFVPWGSGVDCWYPMKESSHKLLMDSWAKWRKLGVELLYRPNYLLAGYGLPAVDFRQSGEMLRHMAKNGMVGFDYDSLIGHWATKGPMIYLHLRLGVNPELTVEQILDEYYSAFGPAKEDIREYFNYWVEYSKKLDKGGIFRTAKDAYKQYPLKTFNTPEKILASALKKAKTSSDETHAKRVEFLQKGLQQGKLCVEFSELYAKNNFSDALTKINQIIDFRKKYEGDYIANYMDLLYVERMAYQNLNNFIQGKFSYFIDPPLAGGKFKRSSVNSMSGLKAVKSSIILPKKKSTGYVTFKYDAGKNNSFKEAIITITAWAIKISNKLEISFDGKNYQLIKNNAAIEKIDITKYISGKNQFYIRFTANRRKEFSGNQLGLYKLRLDFTKKFPDAEKNDFDIGIGWLDFKNKWHFISDSNNKDIISKKVWGKDYNFKGWTNVKVPSFLDNTPVGNFVGYGWYGADFKIPRDWAARSVELLFEGIDEQAWIYINGKKIAEHTVKSENQPIGVLWKKPFIVKVPTNVLNFGGDNRILVKIHSSLGASGIWKPIRIRAIDASAQNE